MKQQKVSEEEPQKVKNKTESLMAFEDISLMNRAGSLATYELLGDANLMNRELEHYQLVTAQQIQEECNNIFTDSNSSTPAKAEGVAVLTATGNATIISTGGTLTLNETRSFTGSGTDILNDASTTPLIADSVVASITPSVATIVDATVGTATFTLTITFNETMKDTTNPTITFPVESVTGTLTPTTGAWDVTDKIFTQTYTVADAGVLTANIDVRVTGGITLAGNTMTQRTVANVFSIDTLNPTVTVLAFNDSTLTEANVGTATFFVTVTFSEAMDTGTAPTISFPVETPTSLTLNAGASGWLSSTQYRAKYNVADNDLVLAAIDVTVSGAKDVAGNPQAPFTQVDAFSIELTIP